MKPLYYFPFLAAMALLSACSSDVEDIPQCGSDESQTRHTVTLYFDGDIQRFEQPVTRASLQEWKNNARIYIQYQTATGLVDGTASYDAEKGEWTATYYGTITRGEVTKCEVYYFSWATYDETTVSFEGRGERECYSDPDATYIYENGAVTLKAHLRPMTGRLRFRGTAGCTFSFEGIKCFTAYHIADNRFSSKNCVLTLCVGEDGFTPYVYASFADETSCQLKVHDEDGVHLYSRDFDATVLAAGESGFIDVPTMQSRNGWKLSEEEPVKLCPSTSHPHKIDMGNGLKWACCNVGVKNPVQGGYCYAWGETSSKNRFTRDNYKYWDNDEEDYTKYAIYENRYGRNEFWDDKKQLDLSDDAARANWGGTWRMPTADEMNTLVSNCTWIWTTIDGTKGFKVIAANGNTIFFPAAGYYDWIDGLAQRQFIGEVGLYWTSTLWNEPAGWNEMAEMLYINRGSYGLSPDYRQAGNSVRPVTN